MSNTENDGIGSAKPIDSYLFWRFDLEAKINFIFIAIMDARHKQ